MNKQKVWAALIEDFQYEAETLVAIATTREAALEIAKETFLQDRGDIEFEWTFTQRTTDHVDVAKNGGFMRDGKIIPYGPSYQLIAQEWTVQDRAK